MEGAFLVCRPTFEMRAERELFIAELDRRTWTNIILPCARIIKPPRGLERRARPARRSTSED
jgi:hypothetical protein